MLFLEDFYAENVHISTGANEPQNVTFIDISNFEISFAPTSGIEGITIAPRFLETKIGQKKNKDELHPFLRT
jgi:hypothetical protein